MSTSPRFAPLHRRLCLRAAALAALSALSSPLLAAELLSGFGADGVYGEVALSPNDDQSSSLLNLPFSVNFFGQVYDSFYVNNNGNITFRNPVGTYTPDAFPVSNQPMIAPWWADVDTSPTSDSSDGGDNGGTGELPLTAAVVTPSTPYAGPNNVYVGSPNAQTLVVTWDQVGYFSAHTDKTNSFQLVLRDRSDTGAGNFDIDFRYQSLQWTTGDASGGDGGLGGVPAQAGFDAGDGVNYLMLPGSRTDAVLDLVNTSNVGGDTPGLWTFAVRNGTLPGNDPSNPLMPVVVDGDYQFDFNVQANTQYFIDPLVAVGYDYTLDSSDPNQSFATLVISSDVGDGQYALFLWDGSAFVDAGVTLSAGQSYSFASGVTRFSIRGIETSAALDPADTSAFVTGLTFSQSGLVSVTQSPLTVDVPAVPEPGSWALMLAGAAAIGLRRRTAR